MTKRQLKALEDCLGVVEEAFFVCHDSDCLCVLLDCLFGILDDAHALEEVVHTERAEETTRAIRGENVVRACKVVAHRFR